MTDCLPCQSRRCDAISVNRCDFTLPLFCLQLFEQGLNNGSGDTKRSYRITPPDPLRSLRFEPKYPTFNTGDGYCVRTELTGCVSTIQEGELVTEGQYKKDLKYNKVKKQM